jgi:hypothetical protein
MKKIREFIISEEGIMLWTILLLIVMVSHTSYIFYNHAVTKDLLSIIMSIIYAIAVEIAILIFVLKGRTKLSLTFGFFQVIINLFYYYESLNEYAPLLLSIEIPLALAAYSHEIFLFKKSQKESELKTKELETIMEVKENLESKIDTKYEELQILISSCFENINDLADTKEYISEFELRLNKVEATDSKTIQDSIDSLKNTVTTINTKLINFEPTQVANINEFSKTMLTDINIVKNAITSVRDSHPAFKSVKFSWEQGN